MSAHEVVEIGDTGPAAPQEEPPPPQKELPAWEGYERMLILSYLTIYLRYRIASENSYSSFRSRRVP